MHKFFYFMYMYLSDPLNSVFDQVFYLFDIGAKLNNLNNFCIFLHNFWIFYALQRHQTACHFRPVICPNNCHEEVMAKDLEEHLSKTCGKIMVPCKICQHQIARSNLENHQNNCSTANAACPYCGEPMDLPNVRIMWYTYHFFPCMYNYACSQCFA